MVLTKTKKLRQGRCHLFPAIGGAFVVQDSSLGLTPWVLQMKSNEIKASGCLGEKGIILTSWVKKPWLFRVFFRADILPSYKLYGEK